MNKKNVSKRNTKLRLIQKRKSRGSITVELSLALIMAAAITYPLIPLVKNVSIRVLADSVDRIAPHYP